MSEIQDTIEEVYAGRSKMTAAQTREAAGDAVAQVIAGMESGELRVAEPGPRGWQIHEWLKKAVLLYFKMSPNQVISGAYSQYFDKVPCRWGPEDDSSIEATGARVVPPAVVRRGAHIAQDVVLMPSYVNIGAYVGEGSMVDTWATVGSCAQIGARCHLSGGVGIGGVLEPLQATPTIIEDDCFIGARSEVVEGVVVERGSVLSMGVFIGQSTRIYDRETGEITRGRVPAGSVVVPGSLPAADGSHSLSCAVIVKQVDEKTRAKVGVNEILRSVE